MFEGEEEIFVQLLCFLARLFEQASPLHKRIVQLGITWRDFLAVDDQLEDIDERVVVQILFRQRHQFLWAMGDEERVEGFLFDQLLEDVLRDFEICHLRLHFDPESWAFPATLFTR